MNGGRLVGGSTFGRWQTGDDGVRLREVGIIHQIASTVESSSLPGESLGLSYRPEKCTRCVLFGDDRKMARAKSLRGQELSSAVWARLSRLSKTVRWP